MSNRISVDNLRAPELSNPSLERMIDEEKDYPSTAQLFDLAKQREIPGAKLDPEDPNDKYIATQILAEVRAQMLGYDVIAQTKFSLPAGVQPSDYGVIVRLSNPGTYRENFKEIDKSKFGKWAETMDRQADDAAIAAVLQLLSRQTGLDISAIQNRLMMTGSDGFNIPEVRKAIQELGIPMFYAGLPEESAAVEEVLHKPSSYISPEQVTIITQEGANTITQLEALKEYLLKIQEKKRVMLVGFAAHVLRALWLAESIQTFGSDREVDLALLPTPASGLESSELAKERTSMVAQEIKATLYYVLAGKAKRPGKDPNPLGNPWLVKDIF